MIDKKYKEITELLKLYITMQWKWNTSLHWSKSSTKHKFLYFTKQRKRKQILSTICSFEHDEVF